MNLDELEKLIEDTKRLILSRMDPGMLYAPPSFMKEWGIGFTEFKEAAEQLENEGLVRRLPVHKPLAGRTKAYLMLTKKGWLRR